MKKIFIIGAQRSGTTFLNQALNLHDSVIGINNDSEEPKTFIGDDWPTNETDYDLKYELELFKNKNYCLEKSTSYYENWHVAERIKNSISDAKIIFIARNPYERMKSNYRFSKKNGLESLDLKDALMQTNRKYKTSVNPYRYINRSLYSSHLILWKNIFHDNLKIVLFENLVDSKSKTIGEICSWLNISINNDFVESIAQIDFLNSTEAEDFNEDYGPLNSSLKYLFKKEKGELEHLIGQPIDCWNF